MSNRRVVQLRKLLENAGGVEAQWDPLLGGRETRGYRDLLTYSAAKMVLAGAAPESVISYLGELFSEHGAELVDLRDALTTLQQRDDGDGDEDEAGDAGEGGRA